LALLESLKDDPELYVRRSVANNLNDIGKDHPSPLVETAREWMKDARQIVNFFQDAAVFIALSFRRKRKDMDTAILKPALAAACDWVVDYFDLLPQYAVTPDLQPGEISQLFPAQCPVEGIALADILREFADTIVPGLTHWNHPGFMAYFNSTTSEPALIAELLIAAVNSNGMNWKSSPVNTELEKITLGWLSDMLGLNHDGIIFDGGSTSNYHAMLICRNQFFGEALLESGLIGATRQIPRFYLSEQCHNSIHKAIYAAGFGKNSLVTIKTNANFEMDVAELEQKIQSDEASEKFIPLAVIGTIGSTSCTATDPIADIISIAKNSKRQLWVHLDAAHGGMAAALPGIRQKFAGWEQADSITVNPHKWLFLPLDMSVLFFRDNAAVKRAFADTAEYLKTDHDEGVENFMDYGLPLGRKFKALKLFFALKYFGVAGLRARIQTHINLARNVYDFLRDHTEFEILAPLTLSTICFRAVPPNGSDVNDYNKALMDGINRRGKFFLTHTKLDGKFTIRIVISSYHVTAAAIDELLTEIITVKGQLDETQPV